MSNDTYPKTLIVCTTPFSRSNQSRAFDTYFHDWPKEKLVHIFSSNQIPEKGICSSLYRITDSDLFFNLFHRSKREGVLFKYEELPEHVSNSLKDGLQRFKKKTWLRFYLRKALWAKKRWLNSKIEKWIDDFKPEMIFCGLSDDYFILDIAYSISKKYNIPIVVAIGDDYYFAKRYNLLVKPYFYLYKKLFKKIMETKGFAVYISNKITEKYNSFFAKQGFPIYLSSDIVGCDDYDIKYEFNYFGNLELGRHLSLSILGDALNSINSSFFVNVYCGSVTKRISNYLKKHHCLLHKSISYDLVKEKMNSGSFNIIASGFRKKDINLARYSLSTKISDALASSGPIIAVGPRGDGAIDYLAERDCAILITSKSINVTFLKQQITNMDILKEMRTNAKKIYNIEHNVFDNRRRFEKECFKMIERNENEQH